MNRDADVLADWSRRHDGYDVSRSTMTRGWVLTMHRLAGPLTARHVPADAVSLAGVAAASLAALAASPRRRAAAALVLATAVCDGLDGAVAGRHGTPSDAGTTVDHGCDRITDVLFGIALARAGAPRPAAVAAATAPLLLETLRGLLRRGAQGAPPVATVGERPARVAAVTTGLLLSPAGGATAVAALSVAGCVQLAVVRRHGQ